MVGTRLKASSASYCTYLSVGVVCATGSCADFKVVGIQWMNLVNGNLLVQERQAHY